MDLRLVIPASHSTISDEDVEDVNALLKHLSKHAPVVSREDILDVIEESRLMVVRDFDVPRGGTHRIVAMATLVPRRQLMGCFGFVEDVATHPDYERRGIGTWLNRKLIEEAKRLGMRHVDLTSGPDREAANHLYRKLGYERRDTNVYRKKLE